MNPLSMLTIDGAEEPEDFYKALEAFFTVVAATPQQEIGNGGAIPHTIDNRDYLVVRNEDSYTVRVGGQIEETPQPEGFPV